jgi:sugar-phosphatase
VTANDVKHGKPQPDPYVTGAERVGVDPKNCKSPFSVGDHAGG